MSGPWPGIAIDARLAHDAGLHVGDTVVLAAQPGQVGGDTVVIGAITQPRADPSDVAHGGYSVRLHLTDLQQLLGLHDRVDRFAMRTTGMRLTDSAAQSRVLSHVNDVAFGFHAYRSADVAVRTSTTYQVVDRFHHAIAGITIVASALFLLCILLLRVDERRRDIAALRLVGLSRASVVKTVMIEAGLIALVGSVFGIALGCLGALAVNAHYQHLYRTPLLFALVTPGIVTFAVGAALVLGILAGGLAALRLVRLPPLRLLGR